MRTFAKVINGSTYIAYVQDDMVELTAEQLAFAEQNSHGVSIEEILVCAKEVHIPTLEELKEIAIQEVQMQAYNAIQGGFQPQGKDFYLDASESAQADFSKGLALLNEGLQLGQLQLTTLMTTFIKDKSGVYQPLTVQEIKVMLFGYGIWVNTVRNAMDTSIAQISACTSKEELEALA